jgi:hypothetical protein
MAFRAHGTLAAILALIAFAAAAPAAEAQTRSCGRIDIDYPGGRGGASALNIRANFRCNHARPLVAACLDGQRPRGWSVRFVRDNSRFGGHIRMRRGARRITYFPAGGGGCQ